MHMPANVTQADRSVEAQADPAGRVRTWPAGRRGGPVTGLAVETFARLSHRLNEQHPALLPAAKLPGRFQAHGMLGQSLREAHAAQAGLLP